MSAPQVIDPFALCPIKDEN